MTVIPLRFLALLVALLAAIILILYSLDIWSGVIKRTPACAPITLFASSCVLGTALLGAVAGAAAMSRGHPLATIAGSLGVIACGAVAVLWVYWLTEGVLLPYDAFVLKTGMP